MAGGWQRRRACGLGALAASLLAVPAASAAPLHGELALVDPEPATRVGADGVVAETANGQHLHLTVRPEAPAPPVTTAPGTTR